MSDSLEYLLLEDDQVNDLPGSGTAIPSRGWSDDLCYGTGSLYLTGPYIFPLFHVIHSHLTYHQSYCSDFSHAHFSSPGLGVGGIWGLREGFGRPLAVSNGRLRINSVLNSVTRRGTFIGNSAGVLGMFIWRLLVPILTLPLFQP